MHDSDGSNLMRLHLSALLPGLEASGEATELLGGLLQKKALDVPRGASARQVALLLRAHLGEAKAGWESPRVVAAREALDRYIGDCRRSDDVVPGPLGRAPRIAARPAQEPRPALLVQARLSRATFAVMFGGNGNPYIDELEALYNESFAAAAVIDAVAARLGRELTLMSAADRCELDAGLDVMRWLREPASRPAADYLLRSQISQPLIFTTQVAHYVRLLEAGYARPAFFESVRVTAGHSQGVMAALLISETLGSTELASRAAELAAWLLYQGLRMQQHGRLAAPAPSVLAEAQKDGLTPAPMASVNGLTSQELAEVIKKLQLPLTFSLDNARLRKVVSGDPAALEQLRRFLMTDLSEKKKKKARGAYAGALPEVEVEYLAVSAPFHSPTMASAIVPFRADLERLAIRFDVAALKLPVIDTGTSRDLRTEGDITERLISMMFLERVAWPDNVRAAVSHGVTHVLDFGPGEGVMKLTASALRGSGVQVLGVAAAEGRRAALDEATVPAAPLSYRDFAPGLARTPDGRLHLDNRFTRWTGRAPVILPGMTPTTADADIVAAAANAGFVAELAGGGQVTEAILRRRLAELAEKLTPGQGVVLNSLYLDPYLWKLHFGDGLVPRLRDEGLPLIGVTVTAGIPPVEEAAQLLRELCAHGLWLNSFKPGTDAQVKQVIAIAQACPEITLAVQLEGGKAGGHHSWEDLENVLARQYHALRARPNLVLAVGGGIATPADAARYLTGAWSQEVGLPPMPVDAVFIGTAVMAAKEAKTSQEVKQALMRAAGTDAWVLDGGVGGGVTSGRSQLDAPIYYLENAAARAGRLLDEVARAPETIAARKEEIIAALAATAKPYFGDVTSMTYEGFLRRVVELLAVGSGGTYEDGRWLDITHRRRFLELVRMAEARLASGKEAHLSVAQNDEDADAPETILSRLGELFPEWTSTRVHPEDAATFVEICRKGGKPVPFVPVIDANVRRSFKSDSLWQSHDPRYAADAVLCLPGPAAIAGITAVDEPVASILDRFEAEAIETLEQSGAAARECASHADRRSTARVAAADANTIACDEVAAKQPERFLARVAAHGSGPLAAALVCEQAVVEEGDQTRLVGNPLRKLFAPVVGAKIRWLRDQGGRLAQLEMTGPDERTWARAALKETRDGSTALACELLAPDHAHGGEVALDLALSWRDLAPAGVLVSRVSSYVAAQQSFYGSLIFGRAPQATSPFETARGRVQVTREQVARFAQATLDDSSGLIDAAAATPPLNMAFALAWEQVFAALSGVGPDVMALLHEENGTEAGPAWPVRAGDTLEVEAQVTSVESLAAGRRVRVSAKLQRDGALAASVDCVFFIRQRLAAAGAVRESRRPFTARVHLPDAGARSFLAAQPWLTLTAPEAVVPGVILTIDCPRFVEAYAPARQTDAGVADAATFAAEGSLLCEGREVGTIRLASEHVPQGCKRHPVAELAALLAASQEIVPLPTPRLLGEKRLCAPADMAAYAGASGDWNPLHVTPQVARFAGLAGTIVHGMWTASAAVHRAARLAADGDARRVLGISARFLAPVELGESLAFAVRQVAMHKGRRVVEVEGTALRGSERVPVLTAKVELGAPRTVYVFPGQGLQRQGMGMGVYARSAAARAVWEEAERVCREKLGFSLLRIVRDNPKELTLHGATLRHPNGVLFLTQFTQVAMAVSAIAQVRELVERGLFVDEAMFCGHSVGEYSAIAAIAGVIPLAAVVEVVFQRGLTMDKVVERDAAGRSPYAMGVVRPHYAGLSESGARELVATVAKELSLPLEIVNHNIRGRQYSVTGDRRALAELEQRLSALTREAGAEKPAYLDVPGIDVPFHSTLLRAGVPAFRETLSRVVPPFDHRVLDGRYVPNLVARPFALSRDFAQSILEVAPSTVISELLGRWDEAARDPDALARTLLIELLAWQFASPVRWIETQALLLEAESAVETLVEVGLAEQPILFNMAQATVAMRPYRTRRPRLLNSEAHFAELFGPTSVVEDDGASADSLALAASVAEAAEGAATAGTIGSAGSTAGTAAASAAGSAAPTTSVTAASTETTRAARPAATAVAVAVADAAPSVREALGVLLALQTKLRPEQVSDAETLDELLGGNSAKRNQVLADVGAEFGLSAIDGAHEMPLGELGKQIAARVGAYAAPGKYLGAAVDQALSRALGAARLGRAEVLAHVASLGLPSGRAQSVLLRLPLLARDGASSRGGNLSELLPKGVVDRASAEAWLTSVATAYAAENGIALGGGTQSSSSVAVDGAALKQLEERLLGPEGALGRAAAALREATGVTEEGQAVAAPEEDERAQRLALYEGEHGPEYETAVAPRFDADKHVAFTSAWAWVRRDVAAVAFALARGEKPMPEQLTALGRRLDEPAAKVARAFAKVARRQGREEDSRILYELAASMSLAPRTVATFTPVQPTLTLDGAGTWVAGTAPRQGEPVPAAFVQSLLSSWVHPVRLVEHGRKHDVPAFRQALERLVGDGVSFANRTALVTGAAPGSIAMEVVRALLAGGARVVLTTSTYTPERLLFYRRLYQACAGRGAELHVVPANQASFTDIDALVGWLTSARSETVSGAEKSLKGAWVPDILVPFGALGELTHLTGQGARSLAVLRVLLLGVERLLGRVAEAVRAHGMPDQRCHVLLPLSPNHGIFGGDGVYGESKAALETLLNRWRAEQAAWGRDVSLVGARIGWVRGTGLMNGNDVLSARLEADTGVRTFSPAEMGLLLSALLCDEVREAAAATPLVADLTGGFENVEDLAERVGRLRDELTRTQSERRRTTELSRALIARLGCDAKEPALVKPRALPRVEVPVPHGRELTALPALDHLDMRQVVVIVGYGEVGPYGSARSRWAMERDGVLSLEAIAELAWMMGLIRPARDGGAADGNWEDVESGKPIDDADLVPRYEARILAHTGVRIMEPGIVHFDPERLSTSVEVKLDREFRLSVATREEAESLRAGDPEHSRILMEAGGCYTVVREKGATLRMARALRLDRNVAAQIPSGWDPRRFGIPAEICEQVDRTTLFSLVAAAEAFAQAGLTPEEIYQHLHPSKVGCTLSSGIGGMQKLTRLYRDFPEGRERQTDVLQETLINVIAGYVVQSFLGSYGPMSFPVNACASAAVSLSTSMDKILLGEADVMLAGAVDDIGEEGAVGFTDMAATASGGLVERFGIAPRTLSRPNDRRRRGFVESQGAGVLLLCRASVAAALGLPVYGVVAYAGSFADGIQRSVPAPGLGALACGREEHASDSVETREALARDACGFARRRARILELAGQRGELVQLCGAEVADALIAAERRRLGHDFFKNDPRVSPLRGALAVFGLTPDDIAFVSKHDTSTQANDLNENRLHEALHRHLGRTADLPLPVVSQKSLTGHPKGAAAAWQVSGILQAMADGVLPGNFNLEDVDGAMTECPTMLFSDTPLMTGRTALRAAMVTSLGFGHVSAAVAIAHPFLFWRMLGEGERRTYAEKLSRRRDAATERLQRVLSGREPLVGMRTRRPFAAKDGTAEQAAQEVRMLLSPGARLLGPCFAVEE